MPHVSHTILLPILKKLETVSHPLKACKTEVPMHARSQASQQYCGQYSVIFCCSIFHKQFINSDLAVVEEHCLLILSTRKVEKTPLGKLSGYTNRSLLYLSHT